MLDARKMLRRGRRTVMREQYECLASLGGCGAAAGQWCTSGIDGTALADVHAARWDQYLGRAAPDARQLAVRAAAVKNRRQEDG